MFFVSQRKLFLYQTKEFEANNKLFLSRRELFLDQREKIEANNKEFVYQREEFEADNKLFLSRRELFLDQKEKIEANNKLFLSQKELFLDQREKFGFWKGNFFHDERKSVKSGAIENGDLSGILVRICHGDRTSRHRSCHIGGGKPPW